MLSTPLLCWREGWRTFDNARLTPAVAVVLQKYYLLISYQTRRTYGDSGGFVTHLLRSRSELRGQIIYPSPDRFVPISFENVPSGLPIGGYFQKEGKLVSLPLIIVHFVCPRNVRQA